jgi:tetratricopeptide (TPR) repeat protein
MVKRLLILLAVVPAICPMVWAEELSQETIEKAYYESYAYEKAQNYPGAIRAMYPVFTAYPKGYTVNFRLGWLSYLNGNYSDAQRYYKTALAVYPAAIEVMQCISLVHKARADWAEVEAENAIIIKIDYFNQTANYWYAIALKAQKKYDLAEKICRKMLTVLPTSVNFLNELGENLYYKKDYTQAFTMFLSVRVLDPQNENAKKFIALLSEKQ